MGWRGGGPTAAAPDTTTSCSHPQPSLPLSVTQAAQSLLPCPPRSCLLFLNYLFLAVPSLHCTGFSLVAVSGDDSNCGAWASPGSRFSHCGAWALGHKGCSGYGWKALAHRLSSCGTWAQWLQGMWDLPGPGMETRVCCIGRRIVYRSPPGKPSCSFPGCRAHEPGAHQ